MQKIIILDELEKRKNSIVFVISSSALREEISFNIGLIRFHHVDRNELVLLFAMASFLMDSQKTSHSRELTVH
jgi:hypothetical protein